MDWPVFKKNLTVENEKETDFFEAVNFVFKGEIA